MSDTRDKEPNKIDEKNAGKEAVPGNGHGSKSLFGRFDLLKLIAVGGMAEIYKARDTESDKLVIIKKILPEFSRNNEFLVMFLDEAKILSQLSHPNIVQIIDFGKVGMSYFMALDFIDGKNLRTLLDRLASYEQSHISLDVAVFIITRILMALEYAHNRKDAEGDHLRIIHRDISPDNILLSLRGEVKIIDFGIAKSRTNSSVTKIGQLKGKLGYMAPEQVLEKKADNRSDIYSAGAVFYEMLTGRRMIDLELSVSVKDTFKKLNIVAPRKINSEIPKKIEKILLKAVEKNPKKRYQTATEFLIDIMEFYGELEYKKLTQERISQFIGDTFPEEKSRWERAKNSIEELDYNYSHELSQVYKPTNIQFKEPQTASKNELTKQLGNIPLDINTKIKFQNEVADNTTTYTIKKSAKKWKFSFPSKSFIFFLIALAVSGYVLLSNPTTIEFFKETKQEFMASVALKKAEKLFKEKKFSESLKYYRQAASVYDEKYMRIYNRLSEMYTQLEDKDTQIEKFQSLVDKNKTYPYIHKQLGDIYLAKGEKEEALRSYTLFLELAPEDSAKDSVARLVKQLTPPPPPPPEPVVITVIEKPVVEKKITEPVTKNTPKKKSLSKKVTKKQTIKPPLPFNYTDLAQKEYFKGNYKKAIDFFKKELGKNPQNVRAHFDLARSYGELSMYDQAIIEYNKVIASKKMNKEARKQLGLLYYEIGEPGRSIKNLLQYLKLETDEIEKQKVKNLIKEIQT